MRTFLLLLGLALSSWACTSETGNNEAAEGTTPADTTTTTSLQAQSPPPRPACEVSGKLLEENQYIDIELNLYVVIKADSSTHDPELGASHRILEVYESASCELLQREVLPVNVSPDFPYYMAQINYNNISQLLAIYSTEEVYLYDLSQQALNGPYRPLFPSERYGVDAQSGHIQQLEMWEDYLVGYEQDYGAFAFKLKADGTAEAIMPLVEHESETQQFHQLFVLASSGGGQQLLLPSYDRSSNTFKINPVFDEPIPLKMEDMRTAQNKRFVLLQDQRPRRDAIVLDLLEHKRRSLPGDINRADDDDIVDWMEMMR
jgi:hypothetical protein